MDRSAYHGLSVFLAVAKAGSLRAAARDLNVRPPAVSQQLKAFEEWMGTPLFVRSTRSIALTDAGKELLKGSQHLVQTLDETMQATRKLGNTTGGTLRINLPYRAWQLAIAPKLAAFQARFPEVQLEFSIDEMLTDIVDGGFHAGVRLGDHLQDGMLRRKLTEAMRVAIVGAPQYLENRGIPQTIEDLSTHDCIGYRGGASGQVQPWHFLQDGEEVSMIPTGRLVFNDMRTAIDAAEQGLGLAWSLAKGVESKIRSGALQEVLAPTGMRRPGFYIYYPRQIKALPILTAFLDHFSK